MWEYNECDSGCLFAHRFVSEERTRWFVDVVRLLVDWHTIERHLHTGYN